MIQLLCVEIIDYLMIVFSLNEFFLEEVEEVFVSLFFVLDCMFIVYFFNWEWGVFYVVFDMFKVLELFYLYQQIEIYVEKKFYVYYVFVMIIGLILYWLDEGKMYVLEVLVREFLQFLDVKKYKVVLL